MLLRGSISLREHPQTSHTDAMHRLYQSDRDVRLLPEAMVDDLVRAGGGEPHGRLGAGLALGDKPPPGDEPA